MPFFMDTHDKSKGSFPNEPMSEAEFLANFEALLEAAAVQCDVTAHGAHISLPDGRAFCLMHGPDADAVRKAHEAIDFPFDSITEVKRVTPMDLRA